MGSTAARATFVCTSLIFVASALPFISPLIANEVFSFRDHTDYFIPLHHFTATTIRAGELPLWNPLNASGERWLANPQTGVFYPPAWLFLILPFARAYVAYLWLHVFVLGIGGFVLFSRWTSRGSALLAAVALMLCGPTLSLLDVSNNLGTFAWLPLVIWSALRQSRFRSLDAALLTLMFLGGEPFLAACGAIAYAALVAARSVGRVVAVGILAVLLSAIQLLPFLEMLPQSDRVAGTGATLRQSMQPRDWLAAMVPTTDPLTGGTLRTSQQYIASMYLGLPILLFAATGALLAHRLDRERQRLVAACLAVFAGLTLLAAGEFFAPTRWLWTELRLNVSRYPSRLVPLAAFALIALAAIGCDVLFSLSKRWRIGTAVGAAAVGTFAFLQFSPRIELGWRLGVVLLWVVVATVLLWIGSFKWLLWIVPLLCVDYLVSARLLVESRKFAPNGEPYRSVVRPPLKIARLYERDVALSSETERRAWLSGYLNLLIRRFDVESPAPVVSARYLEFHDAAVSTPRLDLVNFLSVGFLATGRGLDHPLYQPIAEVGAVTLYRNRSVRPLVQLWSSHVIVPTAADGFARVLERGSNADRMVFVSCRPNIRCRISEALPGRGVVERLVMKTNELFVRVRTERGMLLTVSQQDATGWNVFINGQRAEALRANGIFRAVLIPPGDHEVRWRYRPRFFFLGAALSAIALAAMMGEIFYLCRRRERE